MKKAEKAENAEMPVILDLIATTTGNLSLDDNLKAVKDSVDKTIAHAKSMGEISTVEQLNYTQDTFEKCKEVEAKIKAGVASIYSKDGMQKIKTFLEKAAELIEEVRQERLVLEKTIKAYKLKERENALSDALSEFLDDSKAICDEIRAGNDGLVYSSVAHALNEQELKKDCLASMKGKTVSKSIYEGCKAVLDVAIGIAKERTESMEIIKSKGYDGVYLTMADNLFKEEKSLNDASALLEAQKIKDESERLKREIAEKEADERLRLQKEADEKEANERKKDIEPTPTPTPTPTPSCQPQAIGAVLEKSFQSGEKTTVKVIIDINIKSLLDLQNMVAKVHNSGFLKNSDLSAEISMIFEHKKQINHTEEQIKAGLIKRFENLEIKSIGVAKYD